MSSVYTSALGDKQTVMFSALQKYYHFGSAQNH